MKNIIFILTVVCISLFVYSCTKDNSQTRSDEGKIVETRAGCTTNPPASYIYGVNAGPPCCINVRYLSAFNNLPTTVTYCGTTYGPVTISGGVALLCYDKASSSCTDDIEIKVYDSMGNVIACNSFTQPC